ncbi:Reverse transcriptase (RNA-dependent DNA polymerase) [Stieleria varia]|uniref:Reverse transcriptase (RNA-dependent DNA polymerase) n=1 Tax=Stieleria varia TaxID=2528005 RepID=A0A5C6B526_9BACT|nr:Reverse transcriptase (RNA-dependent DNA polymerase) [Stieleria varia]
MSYKEAVDSLGSPPASCRWKQGRSLAISSRVRPFATGTRPVGRWVAIGLRCRSQSVGFTTGTRPVGVWSNRTNGNSYANDFVIFTKTEAAAQRVCGSIGRFLTERLKLSVNHDKSQIRATDELEYVGYELCGYGGQIRVSKKKLATFKQCVCEIFRRNRGVSMHEKRCRTPTWLTIRRIGVRTGRYRVAADLRRRFCVESTRSPITTRQLVPLQFMGQHAHCNGSSGSHSGGFSRCNSIASDSVAGVRNEITTDAATGQQ